MMKDSWQASENTIWHETLREDAKFTRCVDILVVVARLSKQFAAYQFFEFDVKSNILSLKE